VTVALILAGGLGTRLRSEVPDLPKPLAPIHGRPFLEYQMDYWIDQGVDTFVLSIGYLYEKVMSHFGRSYRNARIEYVIEQSPLGTGGGLVLALDKVRNTESFLLLNGDTYFAVDFYDLKQFSEQKNADWTFALFKTSDTQRYMGVKLDEDQRIMRTGIKSEDITCLANGGVYFIKTAAILEAAFLEKFLAGTKASLESDIFTYELSRGARMFGLESDGVFLDIGIPVDYKASFALFEGSHK
jgi:D-glycero-alpha-D-manno-heptose 1-phosphate guanylyltransferase